VRLGIKIEKKSTWIKSKMGIFANLPTVAPKSIPQSFDLEVLQRRIEEVRLQYGQASGRLFDLCYSIQTTGELPDPEDLSYALATFLQARAMVGLLEEMHTDARLKHAAGDAQRRP
jgi:hypothetical protein